ncbi:MAG: hypothetical protein WCE82_04825 [Halobacteriota archaeon]
MTQSQAALIVGCHNSTVSRHMRFCVAPHVAEIARKARETQGINVFQWLTESHRRTLDIRERALSEGKLCDALRAQEVELKQLAYMAKLTGQHHDAPEMNFRINPEYVQAIQVIMTELGPYPEVKEKVARALLSPQAETGNDSRST